jgi:hypothetical protein
MAKTMTETTTDSDSVTLTRNAKGTYQWEIKCYGADHAEVVQRLAALDVTLRERYVLGGEEPNG